MYLQMGPQTHEPPKGENKDKIFICKGKLFKLLKLLFKCSHQGKTNWMESRKTEKEGENIC